MRFEDIKDFLDFCRDKSTLELPSPTKAVQLRNHPNGLFAQRRIYDEDNLLKFQETRQQDYEGVKLANVEMKTMRAGRAMAIGLVAAYDAIVEVSEFGDLEELKPLKRLISLIRLIECLSCVFLGKKVEKEKFPEINKSSILADIVDQSKVDDARASVKGMVKEVESHIVVEQGAFKAIFTNFWEDVKEIFLWFKVPEYTLVIIHKDTHNL